MFVWVIGGNMIHEHLKTIRVNKSKIKRGVIAVCPICRTARTSEVMRSVRGEIVCNRCWYFNQYGKKSKGFDVNC